MLSLAFTKGVKTGLFRSSVGVGTVMMYTLESAKASNWLVTYSPF